MIAAPGLVPDGFAAASMGTGSGSSAYWPARKRVKDTSSAGFEEWTRRGGQRIAAQAMPVFQDYHAAFRQAEQACDDGRSERVCRPTGGRASTVGVGISGFAGSIWLTESESVMPYFCEVWAISFSSSLAVVVAGFVVYLVGCGLQIHSPGIPPQYLAVREHRRHASSVQWQIGRCRRIHTTFP